MAQTDHYNVIPKTEGEKMYFYFESIGKVNVVKTVQYSPLTKKLEGKLIYNLGFGDLDNGSEHISDKSINNNGDVYKVFNTVLNTVPLFFKKRPKGVILVQGSDSDTNYFDTCKLSCKKRCGDKCKNVGRRIALYCRYVDRHYFELSQNYIFEGGIEEDGDIVFETYEIGKPYSSIFIYKKK